MWFLTSALMLSSVVSALDDKPKWVKPLMTVLYVATVNIAVFWRV